MAVTSNPQSGRLTIDVTETVEGKETVRSRNYTGLKASATDQDVYDVGMGLGSLQKWPIISISRTHEITLTSE